LILSRRQKNPTVAAPPRESRAPGAVFLCPVASEKVAKSWEEFSGSRFDCDLGF